MMAKAFAAMISLSAYAGPQARAHDVMPGAVTAATSAPMAPAIHVASSEKTSPPTRKELLAELAWAKAKYPQLVSLRTDSRVTELGAWLKVGEEITVWVTDSRRQCETAILKRLPNRALSGEHALDPPVHPGERLHLLLRQCRSLAPDEAGRARRECVDESVGHSWWTNNGAITETEINGTFTETGVWGVGDPIQTYGVLSEVSPFAARYRGREARIGARCVPQCLPCARGGSRNCTSCDSLAVGVEEAFASMGGFSIGPCPQLPGHEPCTEPCPAWVANRDQARLARINLLPLWSLASPDESFAGIYRRAETCQDDAAKFRAPPQTHGER